MKKVLLSVVVAFMSMVYSSMVMAGTCSNGDLQACQKAANQGDAYAQYNLGLMYYSGQGVPQDYKQAMKWYSKAANQGKANVQFNLGLMYYSGQGVPQNYKQAMKWYSKAANQGYADAQINLGNMYRKGQGVPQDYKQAVKWYSKAANQGYADAQNNLGVMFDYGLGVPQDYKQAMKWYLAAAKQNDQKAQKNLDRIENEESDRKAKKAQETKKLAEKRAADAAKIREEAKAKSKANTDSKQALIKKYNNEIKQKLRIWAINNNHSRKSPWIYKEIIDPMTDGKKQTAERTFAVSDYKIEVKAECQEKNNLIAYTISAFDSNSQAVGFRTINHRGISFLNLPYNYNTVENIMIRVGANKAYTFYVKDPDYSNSISFTIEKELKFGDTIKIKLPLTSGFPIITISSDMPAISYILAHCYTFLP